MHRYTGQMQAQDYKYKSSALNSCMGFLLAVLILPSSIIGIEGYENKIPHKIHATNPCLILNLLNNPLVHITNLSSFTHDAYYKGMRYTGTLRFT